MARDRSRVTAAMEWVFAGHRAPAFMLALVVLYKLLLIAILLTPNSASGLGAFAEEFKIWCFGYDPRTGTMQSGYVVVMLAEPLVLGSAILLLWGRSMRAARRKLIPSLAAALATVVIASAAFGSLRTKKADQPEFPAVAIRTSFAAPHFELEDQDGKAVTLEALRGKVVVITGVYATCSAACPMIMAQTRRVMSALTPEERAQVVVLAITLDPERDDRARRAEMAKGLAMRAPQYLMVGGQVAAVNQALDDLSIARKRDPVTGVIDHVSMFAVIDKQGRLAYRFTLGESQERWLADALRLLGRE
jgi:protein SCO1